MTEDIITKNGLKKGIITKDGLKDTIDLISELHLNEEDFKDIFAEVKKLFKRRLFKRKKFKGRKEIRKLFKRLSDDEEFKEEHPLKTLMEKLLEKMDMKGLMLILEKIIKDDDLNDFIQDLFLNKLL